MAALGTPSLSGMKGVAGFKSDSKSLSKVSDNSKGMLKVAAELKSPLDGMVSFFSSIDKNIKEVASKTNDQAGDGTTTSTVLCQALATEGFKAVAAGILKNKLSSKALF